MRPEEAIKILQPIGEQYCEIANITLAQRMDEIVEAIDMAIDALKASAGVKPSNNPCASCGDKSNCNKCTFF